MATEPRKTRQGNTSWWEALERFPPYLVRMLAKDGRRWLSDTEIAIASGIPIDRVRQIQNLDDWRAVTAGEMFAFFAACHFDPFDSRDRHRYYQYELVCKKRNATPFLYMQRSPKWESEGLPLIRRLRSRFRSPSKSSAA